MTRLCAAAGQAFSVVATHDSSSIRIVPAKVGCWPSATRSLKMHLLRCADSEEFFPTWRVVVSASLCLLASASSFGFGPQMKS